MIPIDVVNHDSSFKNSKANIKSIESFRWPIYFFDGSFHHSLTLSLHRDRRLRFGLA